MPDLGRQTLFKMSKSADHIDGRLQGQKLKVGLVELVPPIGRLPSLHPDGVRIAWGPGKSLFSGRIRIQGVPKFCFLQNPVFG
jgi:hypothetical protein